MEIILVIGMIAAFFAGAFIRRPFSFAVNGKKTAEKIPEEAAEESKEDKRKREQWNALLNFNPMKGDRYED